MTNQAVVSNLLRQYRLYQAHDGLDALGVANQQQPDLILLDVKMPGMDGFETCRRLKKNDATRDIPVIFLTCMDDDTDQTYGFELGAVDYITKPIHPEIVKARVAIHLELKAQRDLLAEMAKTDPLTGLVNRRYFASVAEQEWNRAKRNDKPVYLLMLDIDHFKAYNDYYGHVAGDICLQAIGQCLQDSIRRAGECVARYGGEEFVCLMSEISQEQAVERALHVLNCIRAHAIPHQASGVADFVTVSMGLASSHTKPLDNWLALLDVADHALYKAKNQGRNRLILDVQL